TLGNSAIIREAVEKNATILIVMMTNGDAFSQDFFNMFLNKNNDTNYTGNIGEMRHNEALTAIKKLGLNESNIVFLGYPDAGLKELFINNWDYGNLYKKSKGSNQNDHSPYSFSYEKNASYNGANVVKNLNQIMNDFNPNIILIPDDGDDHQDHWATSAFVRYVAVERDYNGSMYNYLVHKGSEWPTPFYYSPDDELLPPLQIMELDAKWMKQPLNKSDEELKQEAVESHKTQIFAMKDLLESFIRVNEVFSDYPMLYLKKQDKAYSLDQGMPESSYKDLKSDGKTQSLQQADDLTGAGMTYDDQYLYLTMKSSQYTDDYFYVYHLFLYDGKQFKRMDIQVNNGTAEYLSKASNSIISKENPEVQSGNNMVEVKVPMNLINGTKYVLMSADVSSSPDGKIMDNIALRVFKFVDG
ncbi:MAG: PIG-L deacetylase family protein, partial [Methanobacterium sp.]